MSLKHLFAGPEFGWKMRMRKDPNPAAFFGCENPDGPLQTERLRWLETRPELCLANSNLGDQLVEDCAELAKQWGHAEPEEELDLLGLGKLWEADFILMDRQTTQLAGGCVCLPSSWNLQESVGVSLLEVHDRVPGLNPAIGEVISGFLEKIPAGQAFCRENWGLTRSAELNYHPKLNRPRLDETVSAEEVFLRIEHQAFVRLTHGVVLAVRIEPICVTELVSEPEVLASLLGNLESMPPEVADYKGLSAGIGRVCEILREVSER